LRDQIILFCIILYSALTHTSHLLLLIATASFFVLGWLLIGRKAASFSSIRDRLVILAILCVSGLLGEFAFSYAVRHTIGVDPIRPPFAMARSIADGPGYRFLQNNCTNKTYAVCKYVDRLPVAAGTFLWSKNPAEGVFSVADLPTRTALSLEQTSFLIDVFKFDPAGVITSAIKNFVRQLSRVGLDALFQNQESLQGFEGKLPTDYFAAMVHSRIATRNWMVAPLNLWYSSIYFFSMLALLLILAFWSWVKIRTKVDIFPKPQLIYILTVVLVAIVGNAAICGILSGAASRYQIRISWIPLFILFVIVATFRRTSIHKLFERKELPAEAKTELRSP